MTNSHAHTGATRVQLDYNVAMSDVTKILTAITQGDAIAADRLIPLVYQELRKLAAAKISNEKQGHTLQPTVLVHDAYLRLVDVEQPQQWKGRGHFFAAAAEAMRRILIETARRKQSKKHGGEMQRVDLSQIQPEVENKVQDLLALDEALTEFEKQWPEKAKLVKLRYFAGLTVEEASQAIGVSRATGERHWTYARAWLHSQLKK